MSLFGESGRDAPASREPLILGVTFGVILLGTALLLFFRGGSGQTSVTAAATGASAPFQNQPTHVATTPAVLEPAPATQPKSGFSPFPSAGVFKPAEEPVRVVEKSNAELRVRAKSRVLALQQLGRDIRESLGQVEQNVADYSKQSSEILTNDTGRKLATQLDLVERFEALTNSVTQSSVGPGTVATWREQLTALLTPLVLPADDAPEVVMPGNALEADLQALQQDIVTRAKDAREKLGGLNSLMAAARDVQPGERTLQQALRSLYEDRQQKLVEAKAAGRRKADEAARVALEKAEQEKRAVEVALELAKKNAIVDGLRKQEQDLKNAAARKKRIEENRAAISQYLQPFVTLGYAQPVQMPGTFLDVTKTKDKKPMSLAGLRKIGALNEGEKGFDRLWRAGSSSSNDRPHWPESYNHELIIKAHQLLLDFGDDMVAEGILSP